MIDLRQTAADMCDLTVMLEYWALDIAQLWHDECALVKQSVDCHNLEMSVLLRGALHNEYCVEGRRARVK